jgi:hypothetical protein
MIEPIEITGLVEPAWCDARIAELACRATTGAYPAAYRDNDRAIVDDDALAAWLFERVRPHLRTELSLDGARWELVRLNRRFRACRYRGGQAFCIHRDGAYVPPSSSARSRRAPAPRSSSITASGAASPSHAASSTSCAPT